MKVSDLVVRCLESEGVKYVFGLPGEEIEDLLFSFQGSSVTFIPTRHEQGAAFMADVWGRVSGKAGVCLSTLGPGATNLLTGVADANLDKSPVVAISGQAASQRLNKESHQALDTLSLFRPITKWNGSISDPDITAEVVRKAFKTAQSEKPGAAHIEIPEDIAGMDTDSLPIRPVTVRRPDPDKSALKEVVALLKAAKRPLILAGNGAVRKSPPEELLHLVTKHNIPVVHTLMAGGAIPDASPQSLFAIGFGFRDIVMGAVEAADLVLTVGYDIAEYAPSHWNPKKDKAIVHIDFSEAEVYSHYLPKVEVVADIHATLRELNALIEHNGCVFDPAWYAPFREKILEDIASYELKEGQPFTVPGVINLLSEMMQAGDLLISDVGTHKVWIGRNFFVRSPNSCLISNGLASMGIALPGAVAAALHSPERRIVAAMGDGGFLMNSQELETAKRLGVHFMALIFNDNDYGLISWKQRMSRGASVGTRITNPDFKAYAESFGIKARHPSTLAELRRDLKAGLDSRELNVLDVRVDPSVNEALIRKLKKEKNGFHQSRER